MCVFARLHRLILAQAPVTIESRKLFLTLNKRFRNLILLRIVFPSIKKTL